MAPPEAPRRYQHLIPGIPLHTGFHSTEHTVTKRRGLAAKEIHSKPRDGEIASLDSFIQENHRRFPFLAA
jgi:hypothetical protein